MTTFSFWSARLFSLTFVALAVMAILMALSRRTNHKGGVILWLTYVAMFIAEIASSFLGAKPAAFDHHIVYMLLIMTAIFMSPAMPPEKAAAHAKRAIAIILYGSLILAAISPSYFVETGYTGIIPGFNIRLHGLATHPNNLAPLALAYLLLEYWVPSVKPWRQLSTLVALAVLILAQSKTSWLMMVVIVFAVFLSQQVSQSGKESRHSRFDRVAKILAVFFILLPILILAGTSDQIQSLYYALSPDDNLRTLTGRTEIWDITLEAWERSPWFGFGHTLWDMSFRMSYGQPTTTHAHNQFIHSLGESGIVGLTALLLYVGALIGYALKFATETRGVSIALVLMLLTRSMTEVPFRMVMSLETVFLLHLIVFALLTTLARSANVERSTPQKQPLHRNVAMSLRQ